MRTLCALLFGLLAMASKAQTTPQKIGYADWDYIFSQLPDYAQIDNELKAHGAQLENQLKAKYADYQSKLTARNNLPASTADAVKKDKDTELSQLQESIQKFQQDAQTSLSKKQTDLMAPVFSKVGKAIEEVAKENGYSFIINPQMIGGGDILLYSDDKFNISNLVLKKLGFTPTLSPTPTKQN